jgi:iron complex transport system permease protein
MKKRKGRLLLAATGLSVLALYLLSGRYPSAGFTNPGLFLTDETARTILLSIRVPRALAAILLGAVLGASGASFQSIFGNPLIDSGFLGVSQGAAFGAALAMVAGLDPGRSQSLIIASSFAMAMAALWVSLALAKRFKFGGQVVRLVLSGLAVSAFFSALLAAVKYAADPLSQLPDIVFWTMGSLSQASWSRLILVAPLCVFCLGALLLLRWRTNLLSLDDEVSRSMGLKPEAERALIAAIAGIGVATVTASFGIVAWIGLVVPHAARMYSGPDARKSLPLSMLGGALFALVADGLARSLFQGELPLGIVTAALGSAAFVAAMASRTSELAR